MTISELAAESSVSESTVFKLCRTLDFSGFREFKITLARQYQGPDSISIADEPIKKTDSTESITHKSFQFSIDALNNTLKTLDYGELDRAYKALKDARRVLVISVGISRTTSIFAARQILLLWNRCRCRDGRSRSGHACVFVRSQGCFVRFLSFR